MKALTKKFLFSSVGVFCVIAMSALLAYHIGAQQERLKTLQEVLREGTPLREKNPRYQFIRPLLTFNPSPLEEEITYPELQKKIQTYISTMKKSGELSEASVFAINYDTGWRIGVSDKEKYTPASMLKVVIMMAYLHQAENNPSLLLQRLTYTQDVDTVARATPFNTPTTYSVGKTYTVQEAIDTMIQTSDNGAKSLLLANIDPAVIQSVYTDLGITPPDNKSVYTISTADYSLFFRVLFNASYLWRSASERALLLLSSTTYTNGIVAGIPDGTVVSHKFGENVLTDAQGSVTAYELHDCGIVYAKPSPYFICVMTRGPKNAALPSIVSTLTSLVHEQFTRE